MTYTCSAWEFAPDNHILELQSLQNKILRTIGNFPRLTSVRDLHVDFKIPYLYDYITNYVGNKQKSYKIMRMNMFAVYDKVKPDI
jgi:hypothetical protein